MTNEKPIEEKTWGEFRESGLCWFINTILHMFGWALVFEIEDGMPIRCYPARVVFRGFDDDTSTEGYKKVTNFLKKNIDDLKKETEL